MRKSENWTAKLCNWGSSGRVKKQKTLNDHVSRRDKHVIKSCEWNLSEGVDPEDCRLIEVVIQPRRKRPLWPSCFSLKPQTSYSYCCAPPFNWTAVLVAYKHWREIWPENSLRQTVLSLLFSGRSLVDQCHQTIAKQRLWRPTGCMWSEAA